MIEIRSDRVMLNGSYIQGQEINTPVPWTNSMARHLGEFVRHETKAHRGSVWIELSEPNDQFHYVDESSDIRKISIRYV
jgi:hypothetical protein